MMEFFNPGAYLIHSSPLVQGSQTKAGSVVGSVNSQETEQKNKRHRICIIGDGIESLAVANLFSDESVQVFPVDSPDKGFYFGVHSFEIRQRNANVCFYRGSIGRDLVYEDLSLSVKDSRAVFVCADATKYSDIAGRLHQYLENGQVIALVNAPLGAGLQFQEALRQNECQAQVSIIELGRIFDSILVESGVLLISGLRKRIPVSGLTRNDTRKGLHIIQSLVDETVPASNVFERGFTDVERIVRPVLALCFVIGASGAETPRVNEYMMMLLSSIESELRLLSSSYGFRSPDLLKSIHDFMNVGDLASDTQYETLEEAVNALIKVILGGAELKQDLYLSVLEEDVREIYSLLADFGTHAHISLPTINSVLDLASSVLGKDMRGCGRTVSNLGLVGFDNQEIVDLVNN